MHTLQFAGPAASADEHGMAIYFNSTTEDFDWLSNFSRYSFVLDGKQWPSVEHYFQAQKFTDEQHQERIRLCGDSKTARRLGSSRKVPLRGDWREVQDAVMQRAVEAKFRTHPELVELLLATADEELVESTPRDYYWGCGAKRTGENRLGKLLMGLRSELVQEEATTGT